MKKHTISPKERVARRQTKFGSNDWMSTTHSSDKAGNVYTEESNRHSGFSSTAPTRRGTGAERAKIKTDMVTKNADPPKRLEKIPPYKSGLDMTPLKKRTPLAPKRKK